MVYTDEEYAVLAGELHRIFKDVDLTPYEAMKWLSGGVVTDHIEKIKYDMVRMPYEDLPLHINIASKRGRVICHWRLKIGR